MALALHQKGEQNQAQAICQEILRAQPKHFESMHFLGVSAYRTGRLDLAGKLISGAISVNPNHAAASSNYGRVLHRLKRLDEALASYDQGLALDSDFGFLRSKALHTMMRLCNWDGLQPRLDGFKQAQGGRQANIAISTAGPV